MRRKDRERDADFAWRVLETAPYATLSTVNKAGEPCSVPVSPARLDNAIVFHCAVAGEKLDNLTANPSVCLSAVSRADILAEQYTMAYDSAVFHGRAQIVTDPRQRRAALRARRVSSGSPASFPRESPQPRASRRRDVARPRSPDTSRDPCPPAR